MEKDNETYLKLFWGRSSNNKQKKAKLIAPKVIVLFCFVATFCAFALWNNTSTYAGFSIAKHKFLDTYVTKEFPIRCTNLTETCPRDYPTSHNPTNNRRRSSDTCPAYFKWIHEDLKPWKEKGITREMLEGARRTAHFRLVIKEGKAYVEKYRQSIQTRDVFTLWGILQLLRLYPGKLPDLELLFDCNDRPVIPREKFNGLNDSPPPLFRYCSDKWSLDIVFPDWSFWGWAETNIKPWKDVLKDIKEGNKKTPWKDRVPYAYWKGNPLVASTRKNLMKCNVTDKNDWNTRLYVQV